MNYSMKQWAEDVWRRDDWTCQNCGATTHLDAAHIIPRLRQNACQGSGRYAWLALEAWRLYKDAVCSYVKMS
jgi:5-methylcytosine-specific restriction endonuclease McrA